MARGYYWTYAVSEELAERTFVGFVDMLRYDRAIVVAHEHGYVFLSSERQPTHDRWRSMGMPLGAIDGPFDNTTDGVYEVKEILRQKNLIWSTGE